METRADDYKHNPLQHVILNPYKNSILRLRAKYATYESITNMLNEEGVKVSEATVRKFCRTYPHEVKRLRVEIDRQRGETTGSVHAKNEVRETSPSDAGGRTQSTLESNKPGPKIARERL
jgi:hypothetical protein